MQKNRLTQIGNIRALTIFLVVLGHSIILYSSEWSLYETAVSVPFLDGLKRLIDVPQMPLFFSLSGYLFFFTHEKKRSLRHLLKSKARRLLIPYLGIGLCWLLPIRLAIRYPGYASIRAADIARNFLTSSDVGHLWFLPALFCIFLLAELLLTLAEHLPGIRKIPDIFLGLSAGALYLEGWRIGFGYPPILGAFNNLLWFALGYFLCARREMLAPLMKNPLAKTAIGLATAGLLAVYMTQGSLGVLFSLAMKALCVVCPYALMPGRSLPVPDRVDRNSFGIYLFHSPLIYITFSLIPNASPLLVVFLNLIIFGAAACGLTELLRKTRLRFLIGE